MSQFSQALSRAAAMLAVLAGTVGAQASVRGQVAILERPGEETEDLANVVVYLEPVTVAPRAKAPAPTNTTIALEKRQFSPRVRVIVEGSKIEFPNQDPFRHNVFSKSGPGEFDLGLYGRGESKEARVERAGVYPVFCNIHARMLAFVVAVPTSYVAQPNPDGRFTIAGVPPGTYTLHAWHDRGGIVTQELKVEADGRSDVMVQLDARGYRFVQHKNKFGQEYTNAGRDRY